MLELCYAASCLFRPTTAHALTHAQAVALPWMDLGFSMLDKSTDTYPQHHEKVPIHAEDIVNLAILLKFGLNLRVAYIYVANLAIPSKFDSTYTQPIYTVMIY